MGKNVNFWENSNNRSFKKSGNLGKIGIFLGKRKKKKWNWEKILKIVNSVIENKIRNGNWGKMNKNCEFGGKNE